ncbi:NAD(P)-binding protein [Thozetella sp. PMI_491]|nr:NAD(P)-binding protein [Thozetella sp. PMI_491]
MARIFLTGASGYIGGDVLHLLATQHPEYKLSLLVRDAAKGREISSSYKDVEILHGDLDDADILTQAVSKVDVVLHLAATGHLASVQTIHKALAAAENKSPAYWIQISGASALAAGELADPSRVPGSGSDVVYDDLDGIEAIRSVIRKHPARAVDNYVLDTVSSTPQVKAALVFPPIIYGTGRGPVNQRSVQIPELARVTLERKRGLQVGEGLSSWGNIHIRDVSELFVKLTEKAVERTADERLWNQNGLYLTGIAELPFGEISKRVAAAAVKQGLIPTDDVDQLNAVDSDKLLPHGTVLYGTNARSKARRAKELVGWAPQHETLEEDIPRTVEAEAEQLGL